VSSTFGKVFTLTTWGESHGPAVGAVIDGCPAGLQIDRQDIQRELDRRRPGQSEVTSPRQESDQVEILSGVFEGRTTGVPISLLIRNVDVDSSRYEAIKDVFRPGHADFTYQAKYGWRDYRGGGRASARETAGRVAGGAVAKKILSRAGIGVVAYTRQIGDIAARGMDLDEIERNAVRCPDAEAAQRMVEAITQARQAGDSLGGIVEVVATGVPAGLGEPVFDKLDADIAKGMMSLGAVKGVEIGAGFAVAQMRGSESNDEFVAEDGQIRTLTNHAGGILGGISTGSEIVVRLAVKPTPSIAKLQRTVDTSAQETTVTVEGRHDPCICPRLVPVAEAMLALVLVDHLLRQRLSSFGELGLSPTS
jgi:chorismate synthase